MVLAFPLVLLGLVASLSKQCSFTHAGFPCRPLAVVAVAVGINADVDVGVVDEDVDAVGQRCSTPTMLLSTCCIDIRVGGTIPGLGSHFGH